ncbi:endo-1,4-beta-xylanase [Occultella gossypii]|uniref:Beta-xylanase n=1 Tax=Occultella gossypii TaxID=2800820 RepID=A0ABS7S6K5_9MICO|nr:endo-1,4-beta-xylanase [Occultella gossypii]MBZ2195717.1 endo-1,4-beta-xylanase [Occultella gossypii]
MSLDHRRVTSTVQVTDRAGAPLDHREVTVRQLRHAFEFGCAGFDIAQQSDEYRARWLDVFDTATLPFYWGRYEPVRGRTGRDELLRDARWFADHGVRLKGHPLVWHTVKAAWLDALPLDEAEQLLRRRIRREVADFAGLIDAWDAINEVVIMPRFTNEPDGVPNAITRLCARLGRVEMVRLAVTEAGGHAEGPPRLILNDFDLGPEYEELIEGVLEAGIPIAAIGLQSHMHKGFRGEEALDSVCERFARFGLPLHWTETTLVSGDPMPGHIEDLNDFVVDAWPSTSEGEARQAEEIVRHYRTLVAHPAVASITYWGLGDAGAWLNAPAGLLRADESAKPAYRALRDLVRGQWWLPETTMGTDADGRIAVAGFAGTYEVASGRAAGEFPLSGTDSHVTVALD